MDRGGNMEVSFRTAISRPLLHFTRMRPDSYGLGGLDPSDAAPFNLVDLVSDRAAGFDVIGGLAVASIQQHDGGVKSHHVVFGLAPELVERGDRVSRVSVRSRKRTFSICGFHFCAASSRPEVQHCCKDYNGACQAQSQRVADPLAGNASASFISCFFRLSLGVMFGHDT
jgi:hypothetical protein